VQEVYELCFLFLAFDLSGVALRARRDWLIARRLLVLDWPGWLAGWLAGCVVVRGGGMAAPAGPRSIKKCHILKSSFEHNSTPLVPSPRAGGGVYVPVRVKRDTKH
jgi:hypothetical protein